jgi:glycosyltransferase involved in cell wall biosynthesis
MMQRLETLVVIPTRNRSGMLPEAVESVLSQDYPAVRTVIVDDGSTDATPSVCRRYAEAHRGKILALRAEGIGCAASRNLGLAQLGAQTGYVCFLDDDDRFLPGKIAREVALLEANPGAGFVYGDAILYDESARAESRRAVAAAGRPADFGIEHFLTNEAKTSAILYRARAVRERRFREELRHNEDSEFLQRVALEYPGVYCPEPGTWIRWHAGSKSRDAVAIHRAVLRANEDLLGDFPDFHRRFGRQIALRMKTVRTALFTELAMAGEWGEASRIASGPVQQTVVLLRLGSLAAFLRRAGIW